MIMVPMWQELKLVERTLWTSSVKIWVQGQVPHLLISWLGPGVFITHPLPRSFLVRGCAGLIYYVGAR